LADCQAMQLKGFYNEQRTIFLHADFRQTNLQDQSWLVHELVHYLQWSIRMACPCLSRSGII
ncbi:hypothetical protein, partial [Sagittula sp.]|uniref:hypothetical protein n=1 Tax=Sagittula sp. TaxID=2038081 RepID=UPI00351290DE